MQTVLIAEYMSESLDKHSTIAVSININISLWKLCSLVLRSPVHLRSEGRTVWFIELLMLHTVPSLCCKTSMVAQLQVCTRPGSSHTFGFVPMHHSGSLIIPVVVSITVCWLKSSSTSSYVVPTLERFAVHIPVYVQSPAGVISRGNVKLPIFEEQYLTLVVVPLGC